MSVDLGNVPAWSGWVVVAWMAVNAAAARRRRRFRVIPTYKSVLPRGPIEPGKPLGPMFILAAGGSAGEIPAQVEAVHVKRGRDHGSISVGSSIARDGTSPGQFPVVVPAHTTHWLPVDLLGTYLWRGGMGDRPIKVRVGLELPDKIVWARRRVVVPREQLVHPEHMDELLPQELHDPFKVPRDMRRKIRRHRLRHPIASHRRPPYPGAR